MTERRRAQDFLDANPANVSESIRLYSVLEARYESRSRSSVVAAERALASVVI